MKEWKASTELQILEAFETSARMANNSLQVNIFLWQLHFLVNLWYICRAWLSTRPILLFSVHLIHDPSHHQPFSIHQKRPGNDPGPPLLVLSWSPLIPPLYPNVPSFLLDAQIKQFYEF